MEKVAWTVRARYGWRLAAPGLDGEAGRLPFGQAVLEAARIEAELSQLRHGLEGQTQ